LTVTLSAPLPFSASLIAHGTLELQGFLISGEPCDIHLQRVLTGEHLQCEPALLGLKVTVCPGGAGSHRILQRAPPGRMPACKRVRLACRCKEKDRNVESGLPRASTAQLAGRPSLPGRIVARLDRLNAGLFGDWKSVGGGVCDLRRLRLPRVLRTGRKTPILLLCGRIKRTQAKDIEKAHAYWKDYKARTS
jgi:putative addiction module killer protein